MKTNNDIKGRGVLKTEYYQLWADYFVRYVKLIEKNWSSRNIELHDTSKYAHENVLYISIPICFCLI